MTHRQAPNARSLKLKRVGPGYYTAENGRYEIVRYTDEAGRDVWWGWNEKDRKTEDRYATKHEALDELEFALRQSLTIALKTKK